jgi:hypothetical protein
MTLLNYLKRYYGPGLILALLAPLWWQAASAYAGNPSSVKDALIWTVILLGCWSLPRRYSGFQVKGVWRNPSTAETLPYARVVLTALLLDFGSKALFFRWDRPYPVEIFKNFGLHSVFHQTEFEPFHFILLLYFSYIFVVGALFFRFTNKAVDRLWLISSAFALAGATALFSERFMFGGVHNSFYFAGKLMWLCPPCASPHFASYAWTPADFFVHALFMLPLILLASYCLPASHCTDSY